MLNLKGYMFLRATTNMLASSDSKLTKQHKRHKHDFLTCKTNDFSNISTIKKNDLLKNLIIR